ncbi:hypothetical protein RSAG8_13761, partial [Rhizoctonia solani AG-8 WAC10335]
MYATRQIQFIGRQFPGDGLPCGTLENYSGQQLQHRMLSFTHLHKCPLSIPRIAHVDQVEHGTMVNLIISQYLRLVDRAPVRPFRIRSLKL